MTDSLIPATGSPFDSIRRVREDGSEYWVARELMPLLGYTKWQNFERAIEQAMIVAETAGVDVAANFTATNKVSGTRGPASKDYELSRYASYVTAMRGDSHKPEIAEALTYFAVRTREAETAASRPVLSAVPDLSGLGAEGLEWLGQIGQALTATTTELASTRKELEAAKPKLEYVDNFVTADEGACLLRVFANQVKVDEQDLRDYLIDRGVIYNKPFKRWSGKKQRLITVNQYHAYGQYKTWFTDRDQPEAPRTPDGRMQTTLDITPAGKTGVLRLLQRHPIQGDVA